MYQVEVRDMSSSRWGKNKLFSSIAHEKKSRELAEERRKRDMEIYLQELEMIDTRTIVP